MSLTLEMHRQILYSIIPPIMDDLERTDARVTGPAALIIEHLGGVDDEGRYRLADQAEVLERYPEIPEDEVGAEVLLIFISDAVGASWLTVPIGVTAPSVKGGAV